MQNFARIAASCSAALALAIVAGSTVGLAPASAANAQWNGDYRLTRYAASKTGTSLAARQHEPDFSDVYTFQTSCTTGTCIATVVAGPPAANQTIPRPPKYHWDGHSWVEHFDWQWDCYMGAGVPKVYAPAHSDAYYTPQPDGTMRGVWTTVIDSGPCQGDVTMNIMAAPVRNAFGS
ncbi:hypothetical protein [Jongsikchunia kroppenstedtii]|uniref:hypothetical protein n=1 Tax=Jongsikchunia kroppenstedtii TaxID=1121721 RepID=UPI00035D4D59|nr:hypothetical protein [Jongsikchunia kroppenstedtii]